MSACTVIAIDGPSASGKSTVSRRVALALARVYVDSGSLYRGIAWKAVRDGIDAWNPSEVAEVAGNTDMAFFLEDGAIRFRLDGVVAGEQLRTAEVNGVVSPVAAVPEVRTIVVSHLRDMTRFGDLVMEGRDIGTAVFPDAPFKFYLHASGAERARRRHAEIDGRGEDAGLEAVDASLKNRDRIDSTRKKDPLRVAEDAVVIDSTSMGIEEVVQCILERVR